jgi:hypothetical protein
LRFCIQTTAGVHLRCSVALIRNARQHVFVTVLVARRQAVQKPCHLY